MGCVGAGAGNGTEGAPISSPGRLALRPAQSYRSLCTSQSLHFPLTHYITFSFLLCPPSSPFYGHIIFSLLHFLPLHLRICPSARRECALSLIRCSRYGKKNAFILKTIVKKNANQLCERQMKHILFCGHFLGNKKMLLLRKQALEKQKLISLLTFSPLCFCFLRFSLPHLWAVSVTLFYNCKKKPNKEHLVKQSHKQKKKCNLTVQEIREV